MEHDDSDRLEEAVLAAAIMMLMEANTEGIYPDVKVREVWPKPSAWRWAPIGRY